MRPAPDGVPDDLGPDGEVAHGRAALLDDAREARALPCRELEGQAVGEVALADEVLDVVQPGADDLDDDLVVIGDGQLLGDEVQLVDVSVAIELDGSPGATHVRPPCGVA
jgi:hypothetical protein